MIVEGYTIDLYCDGEKCPHGNREYDRAQAGGRNKKAAWKDARDRGWKKIRDKVYCCECVEKLGL